MAATHTGQESAYIDFESKALHAGMLDLLGMEICDVMQVVAYNMPRGAADAPLIEIGMGTMDQNKGVLIAYGHNLAAGAEAMIYAENNNLWDKVDIGGVCCTAHDLNRIGLGKGEAKVPEIPQGEIRIQVIAKGFQTFGQIFDVTEEEKTIEIKLNPPQQQYSSHQ